jgi:hypothetical protein
MSGFMEGVQDRCCALMYAGCPNPMFPPASISDRTAKHGSQEGHCYISSSDLPVTTKFSAVCCKLCASGPCCRHQFWTCAELAACCHQRSPGLTLMRQLC